MPKIYMSKTEHEKMLQSGHKPNPELYVVVPDVGDVVEVVSGDEKGRIGIVDFVSELFLYSLVSLEDGSTAVITATYPSEYLKKIG